MKKWVHDAVLATIDPFWDRARIPLRARQHLIANVEKLFMKWKTLKTNKKLKADNQMNAETVFLDSLDDLFDVAH